MIFSFALVVVGFFAQVEQRIVIPGPTWPDIRDEVAGISQSLKATALESINQCTKNAFGATTNTSDLRGCIAAAGKAQTAGEAAFNQVKAGIDQLQAVASQ